MESVCCCDSIVGVGKDFYSHKTSHSPTFGYSHPRTWDFHGPNQWQLTKQFVFISDWVSLLWAVNCTKYTKNQVQELFSDIVLNFCWSGNALSPKINFFRTWYGQTIRYFQDNLCRWQYLMLIEVIRGWNI